MKTVSYQKLKGSELSEISHYQSVRLTAGHVFIIVIYFFNGNDSQFTCR